MNKLIPLFILPCTLALYVFDFYFCSLHPASQIEVTTVTVDDASETSTIEATDPTEILPADEAADTTEAVPTAEDASKTETISTAEDADTAETISATEVVTEAPAKAEVNTDTFLYYPSDLINEINIYRSSYGLSALSEDSQLDHAAAVRCNELLISMSHTRPDGRSCSTVYAELGIYPSVWGENLAAGYCTAAGTASDWMSSDGHRANILNPSFTKCGVAHITCDYGYYDYWVILFSD